MATTTIHGTMLNELRTHLAKTIAYGRYQVGGVWYRAEINSSEVQANGAVHATFYIEQRDSAASPATQFQLCNAAGAVLAERTETIAFAQYVNKILVRFKFGISVGTAG
ncbi:MAG: hypothetical protein IJ234_08665 [Clostridia bacterium]|nr:hypothetical protein [Clostridia bacterium]